MPFLFQTDPVDDDTIRKLSLVYDYRENIQVNGSWINDVSRLDSLEYVVTLAHMKTVLNSQHYSGFPLAMDTETWEINDSVTIDSDFATIIGSDYLLGFDCWVCEFDSNNLSTVSYDSVSGVLVRLAWVEIDYVRIVELEQMAFTEPIQPIKREGVLLTAIFIELAVIVWLLADRRKIPG